MEYWGLDGKYSLFFIYNIQCGKSHLLFVQKKKEENLDGYMGSERICLYIKCIYSSRSFVYIICGLRENFATNWFPKGKTSMNKKHLTDGNSWCILFIRYIDADINNINRIEYIFSMYFGWKLCQCWIWFYFDLLLFQR